MKKTLAILVLAVWLPAASEAQGLGSGPKAAVTELLAAFNAHDVDLMLEACAEDIVWMMVGADKISVEASGAEALREGMAAYFESVPSASSVLRSAVESGPSRQPQRETGRGVSPSGPWKNRRVCQLRRAEFDHAVARR